MKKTGRIYTLVRSAELYDGGETTHAAFTTLQEAQSARDKIKEIWLGIIEELNKVERPEEPDYSEPSDPRWDAALAWDERGEDLAATELPFGAGKIYRYDIFQHSPDSCIQIREIPLFSL